MRNKLVKLLRIIIDEIRPDKVILFGLRARGDKGLYSDYDILIIKEDLVNGRVLLKKVYSSMSGMGAPVDIILVDGKKPRENFGDLFMVYGEPLKEGRTLYAKV